MKEVPELQMVLEFQALVLQATVFVAAVGVIAKETTAVFGVQLAVFLRFFFPLMVLIPLLTLSGHSIALSKHFKTHLFRGLFVTLGQTSLFYYLLHGSLVNGALFMNTAPIFITLIVMCQQRQWRGPKTWMSLLLGLLGVVMILKPDEGLFEFLGLIGLAAGFLTACSQVINHKLSQDESGVVIGFHLYMIGSLYSILLMLPSLWSQWILPTGSGLDLITLITPFANSHIWWIWLLFVFVSFGSQICRSKAYAKVHDAAKLAPFLFFTVLVSALMDWILYQHWPDLMTLLGGGLIFISSFLGFEGTHQSHEVTHESE